jgi:hypothetical protein
MRVIEGGNLRSIMRFFVFYGEETNGGDPSPPNIKIVVAPDEATARGFLPADFRDVRVQVLKQTPKIGMPAGLIAASKDGQSG